MKYKMKCNLCENGIISGICAVCNGSGEGRFERTTCYACKGSGEQWAYCSCKKGVEKGEEDLYEDYDYKDYGDYKEFI